MALIWLVVLVIYGVSIGWGFPPLFWWLLVPMFCLDIHLANHKR